MTSCVGVRRGATSGAALYCAALWPAWFASHCTPDYVYKVDHTTKEMADPHVCLKVKYCEFCSRQWSTKPCHEFLYNHKTIDQPPILGDPGLIHKQKGRLCLCKALLSGCCIWFRFRVGRWIWHYATASSPYKRVDLLIGMVLDSTMVHHWNWCTACPKKCIHDVKNWHETSKWPQNVHF